MKSATRFSLERASGLALAALAIITGAWAIYHFGPRPKEPIVRQEDPDQRVAAPVANQVSAPHAPGSDLFSALFKSSVSVIASGRSGETPVSYVESLEATYRRRGYQKLAQEAVGVDRKNLEKLRSQ